MGFLIRVAGRRDLEAIQGLWLARREAQSKLDARFELAPKAAERAREHREIVLADPRTQFLVADDRGRLLGFAHAEVESNDPAFAPERFGVIADLWVVESRRREGIGRALLERSVEWFRSKGLAEYRLTLPELEISQSAELSAFLERAGASRLVSTLQVGIGAEPSES